MIGRTHAEQAAEAALEELRGHYRSTGNIGRAMQAVAGSFDAVNKENDFPGTVMEFHDGSRMWWDSRTGELVTGKTEQRF